MISFMAIDHWQEIINKFKNLNQFVSPNVLKTIFRPSNIKRKFPQFSPELFLSVIGPSTPCFLMFNQTR